MRPGARQRKLVILLVVPELAQIIFMEARVGGDVSLAPHSSRAVLPDSECHANWLCLWVHSRPYAGCAVMRLGDQFQSIPATKGVQI